MHELSEQSAYGWSKIDIRHMAAADVEDAIQPERSDVKSSTTNANHQIAYRDGLTGWNSSLEADRDFILLRGRPHQDVR
jgi:hypothetical protein